MGCCCGKDGSDSGSEPLLNDRMTESDAGSQTSWFEEEKIGPMGDNYPTWIKDEDAKMCYNCEIKFSMTERRHHCRRCRNVFCAGCSAHKSPIISYGMPDDVKVCEACKTDLQPENFFLTIQKPLLTRGENFKRYKMMGMTSYIVKLRLLDEHTLIYDGDLKPDPEEIKILSINKISMTNLTTFELVTSSKSYSFEADSIQTLKTWTDALGRAVAIAKEPSLKSRIEDDRRKRIELRKRDKSERQQARLEQAKRQKRTEALTSIKDRYAKKNQN
jgi:hypothetical protein